MKCFRIAQSTFSDFGSTLDPNYFVARVQMKFIQMPGNAGEFFGDGEFSWPEIKGSLSDLQRSGIRR